MPLVPLVELEYRTQPREPLPLPKNQSVIQQQQQVGFQSNPKSLVFVQSLLSIGVMQIYDAFCLLSLYLYFSTVSRILATFF